MLRQHIKATWRPMGFALLSALSWFFISAALANDSANPPSPDQARFRIEVLEIIKENFVDAVDLDKFPQTDLKALVLAIDPNNALMDAQEFRELQVQASDFGAIGVELKANDGTFEIVSIVGINAPATQAGLSAGDRILAINNISAKDLTLPEAIVKLRGKPRSSVLLSILRKGAADPEDVTIKREVIRIQNLMTRMLDQHYLYVLPKFNQSTPKELVEQLNKLYQQQEIMGIVLDLRDNSGGLLNTAVEIAALFLPPDVLVATLKGRTPSTNVELHAKSQGFQRFNELNYLKILNRKTKDIPLVVLVNGKTAAGAEMVAAALQDYRRATIIGTQTFGHTKIQTIFPFAQGSALKLTTARWYSPKQQNIQKTGIIPDITIPEHSDLNDPAKTGLDNQQHEALQLLKAMKILAGDK